ncbi:hypothetical protein BO70DRAFT_396994 [Aspergillus heteromorphus CBS 117.55]|uniref:Uncharacterized protein n=1 Tax=Aspergillus heteromorphus CBS 117.55 TaxID=1448321 RepID=A0A317W556_9EURO|nr:uncharacterized protein BO70DRAFT_396994 [Aspergillus heteromorphus CBS 117.55]PWY80701.1 hypothetical protein BO70DRAFT_396994 [Aspergillus heteromorphus CBS 117.55]
MSTSKQKPTTTTTTKPSPSPSQQKPHLSANFAHPSSHQIDYDHETYLHLIGGGGEGKNQPKTLNQVFRENLVRRSSTRALDPAVVDPRGQRDPSPLDLEWAESQRVRDRLVGG